MNLLFGASRAPKPGASELIERADAEGYKMFFLKTLAVPAARFRPPMQLGDIVAEHAQNVYLIKVKSYLMLM